MNAHKISIDLSPNIIFIAIIRREEYLFLMEISPGSQDKVALKHLIQFIEATHISLRDLNLRLKWIYLNVVHLLFS